MTRFVLLVALLGCGTSESSELSPPAVDQASGKRLCERVDLDKLSRAMSIPRVTLTGGGTLIRGGGEPATLVCSYYEGSKVDNGYSFGFSITATTTLERRDVLGRFAWKPFDGLGRTAEIGRAKDGVHVQTVVNGVRLQVNLGHESVAVAELEPKLVAATKALFAQLPDDAAAELR